MNWALLVFHRLRLLYLVLEIWKRPNSPPPLLVHRSLQQPFYLKEFHRHAGLILWRSAQGVSMAPCAFILWWVGKDQCTQLQLILELSEIIFLRQNYLPAGKKTESPASNLQNLCWKSKKEQSVKSKPIQYTTILLLAIVRHMLKIKNAIIEWIICTLFLHNWPTNDW